MYYTLCEDVFLVDGIKKSCIYDLKGSKLFSINNLLAEKIKLINNGEISESEIDYELKKVVDYFVSEGLIKLSDRPEYHEIHEIKDIDEKCKFAWIEITSKCNLRCKHCYNESDIQCDSIMSLDKFKMVIDALVDMKVPKIQVIGGEPFFDKLTLRAMMDYVIGKFEYIEIFTNGTLFDDTWFEYLAQNNIHIALSVYSYNGNEHDKVTGVSGSWLKTNKTIQRLKDFGISYRVCNVLMKGIELGEKTDQLYTLSEKKDVVRMSGRGNFSLLSDELIKKKLITKETFQKSINKAFCRRLVSGHNCFKDKIYISANLEVFPCVMERRISHCSIENGKICLNDEIRFLTKDKVNECSQCEYRYACFDCRPDSLCDNIYAKPWYCTYDPQNGEWQDENDFIENLKKMMN